MVNCQLCLRYADLYKVNDMFAQLHSDKHGTVQAVHITQGKTGDQVYIPIPDKAAGILKEFNNTLPLPKLNKSQSSYTFNLWLKQAA